MKEAKPSRFRYGIASDGLLFISARYRIFMRRFRFAG